jgi:hypothetical protein
MRIEENSVCVRVFVWVCSLALLQVSGEAEEGINKACECECEAHSSQPASDGGE